MWETSTIGRSRVAAAAWNSLSYSISQIETRYSPPAAAVIQVMSAIMPMQRSSAECDNGGEHHRRAAAGRTGFSPIRLNNLIGSASLAAEHQHAGRGEHPAVPQHHADVSPGHLSGRFAPDLPYALLDREHAVHAGVGVGQAAAVGVERQATTRLGVAVGDERASVALGGEAERFES